MCRLRLRIWLGLAASVGFLSPLSAQAPSSRTEPPLTKPDRATITTLQERLPELMKEATVPGVSLALIRGGRTYWVGNFGVRDAKSQQSVTDDTIFEAASLSKPVLAYGALKLVDQGKLDLDAPLTRYLPKPYIKGDARLEMITARYVLSHRTGFPNWRGDGNPLTIRFTPGERFSYSGEGFVYLQKVVEQLTGKSLNDYMTEAVFVPLGMTSSSYVWRADYDSRTAFGHDGAGQVREKAKPKDANAAASLHTIASDYARFVEAVLNKEGLKQSTLEAMERPQIAVNPECTNCTDRQPKELSKTLFWGLGVGIQQTRQGKSLWHWGDNGAFKCFFMAYPKQKIGVVLFTNGENGLSIASEVVRDALGGDQPAFDWIKYDRYDSPAMKFAKAVREKGPVSAIAEFRPALMRGDIPERSINALGYQLLNQKKLPQAIQIFQLNVELFPQSSNTYDSLAEAYMDNGDKELAIQNYQKSLDLDPKNTNAVDMLKKIRQP
jgi:CubicO group peptidase (beta-lactamase class C family)